MAVQYRQLQSPAQIDTSFQGTGSSAVASQLAQTFKAFEGVAASIGTSLRQRQGEREGAAQGATGTLKPVTGFRSMTAYGEAYNNAALRSYAIRAEADAEDQAARLEVEAGNDPERFRSTFGAVQAATVKAAPAEAQAVLNDIFNRRLGAGLTRLSVAQAKEIRDQQRADTSEGLMRAVDRISSARASDDLGKLAEADEEEAKLTLMIDGAEADGTLTRVEAAAARVEAARSITKQTVVARFKRVLDDPYASPIDFIKRLKDANKTSEALPPDEEAKLEDALLAELREHNALNSAAASADAASEAGRFEAGDQAATALLLSGQLTQKKLLDMVESQDLKPAVARTLLNELQAGDPKDEGDPKLAFHVRTNLMNYDESQIASMAGLSWKTRGDLIEQRRKELAGWKGTQAAREASARIDRALGIAEGFMGVLDKDKAEQRDLALTEWYNVVDGLPPAERQAAVLSSAEEVIGKFIRKNKATEAQALRRAKDRFVKSGDPANMGADERKTYEERVARYDRDIAAAEAEAARQ